MNPKNFLLPGSFGDIAKVSNLSKSIRSLLYDSIISLSGNVMNSLISISHISSTISFLIESKTIKEYFGVREIFIVTGILGIGTTARGNYLSDNYGSE